MTAVWRAFAEHRPLVLGPDDVWLCLAQGFAAHMSVHAERLRGRFVRHAGKQALIIDAHDFAKGSPDNPWPRVFGDFSAQIAEQIGRRDLQALMPMLPSLQVEADLRAHAAGLAVEGDGAIAPRGDRLAKDRVGLQDPGAVQGADVPRRAVPASSRRSAGPRFGRSRGPDPPRSSPGRRRA